MDPATVALIGAGSSGLSSILGNVGSVRAQKLANKANLQIAQMNNEWNAQQAALSRNWQEQMMNKQNQWNLDQWNRENQYNSASAQRQRYEEAGLNSALMMQGNGAGTAGSVTSANAGQSPTPQAQQVTMQAPRYDFSGIAQAINSYYANQKLAEEAGEVGRRNTVTDNIIQQQPNEYYNAFLAGMSGRDVADLSPARINAMNRLAPLTVNICAMRGLVELDNMNREGEFKAAQTLNLNLDSQGKQILNNYLDKQQAAEYLLKIGQAFNAFASGNLSMKKVETEVWNAINAQWTAKGTRLDTNMKRSLYQSTMAAIHAEYEYKRTYYNARKAFAKDIAAGEGHSAQAQSYLGRLERDYYRDWYDSPDKRFLWKFGKMSGNILQSVPVVPMLNMGR